MKILIDESLPRYLKHVLAEYAAFTVQELGWTGIKNGELLTRANNAFDVLLTADKNLRYQQNLHGLTLAIIVFPSNRLSTVTNLTNRLKDALGAITPGKIVELA